MIRIVMLLCILVDYKIPSTSPTLFCGGASGGHNDGNLKTANASIRGKAGRALLTCIILARDTVDTGLVLLALEAREMLRRNCEGEKHDHMYLTCCHRS